MKKSRTNKMRRREVVTAYLMMAPDLILILVFLIAPIVYAIYLSFFDWSGLGAKRFVAMQNYKNIWKDSMFLSSLKTTGIYTVWVVILLVILSLFLALLISSCAKIVQGVFRTCIFMPYAISAVVAGLMWAFIYDQKRGYLNRLLYSLGMQKQGFISDSGQALYCIIPIALWLSVGYNAALFIVALKEVPSMYYEAAELDGASTLKKFWYITLPSIKNTTLFVTIVTTIGALQVFELIQVMTNGGPGQSTKVAVLHIYQQAFVQYKFGYASAMAVVLLIVIMIVTLIQFKVMGADNEGAEK